MGMVGLRGADVFVVAPASSFHHNQHHHHHHHQHDSIHSDPITNSNTALGVGVGLIPLLTPGNMGIEDGEDLNLNSNRSRGGSGGHGIQLWQNQQSHHHHTQSNYLNNKKPMLFDPDNSMNLLTVSGSGGGNSGATTSTATCQDCGNQAKKDCSHRRCRTCCKSRGYDCATHIKSTWVPAARRRERQLSSTAVAASSGSTSGVKKPRLVDSHTTTSHTSTSNTTPPRSFDTSSSHQDASFRDTLPGQIRAPAVFKCVRVTAVDDGDDEYAYQAVVKIGGHVFKGFLYDQGIEGREGFPNMAELHLGGTSGNAGRNGASSSSPVIDPSDVYAASGGGLLGGLAKATDTV
ncbi:Lateral root primordium [Thalictrum thalictroides]|uniref:Lateral root primordium n=1 Tax=Thalictrum thalictroides TaxID=46969 RepID=A0A7J6WVB0_THATH|nr:Lateral root primordium [Thalictrum thalictroides]